MSAKGLLKTLLTFFLLCSDKYSGIRVFSKMKSRGNVVRKTLSINPTLRTFCLFPS